MNKFVKSHGLGNSYIVLDQENIDFDLTPKMIQQICSIDYGIGSDGILLKVASDKADFGIRIFNPDGSVAEKSGNGLRIFGKYLFDYGFTKKDRFSVETIVGLVDLEVLEKEEGKASLLRVAMGKASFESKNIPVNVDLDEVIGHNINVLDRTFEINCVSLGNPHCVILQEELDVNTIKKYGKHIENHILFPQRTNVQFAKIRTENEVDILIWERGAEYTLASGSSSCAVAAVGKKLGLLGNHVTLNMPGGVLHVEIDDDWHVFLTGPVEQICEGKMGDAGTK